MPNLPSPVQGTQELNGQEVIPIQPVGAMPRITQHVLETRPGFCLRVQQTDYLLMADKEPHLCNHASHGHSGSQAKKTRLINPFVLCGLCLLQAGLLAWFAWPHLANNKGFQNAAKPYKANFVAAFGTPIRAMTHAVSRATTKGKAPSTKSRAKSDHASSRMAPPPPPEFIPPPPPFMPHIIGGSMEDISFMEQGAGAAGAHASKAHRPKEIAAKPAVVESSAPLPGSVQSEPLLTSNDLEVAREAEPAPAVVAAPLPQIAPRPQATVSVSSSNWSAPDTHWQTPRTVIHAHRKQTIINR